MWRGEVFAISDCLVDVSQLFYHIVWPHGGSPSDLIASIQGRLGHYISAKDYERIRAGDVFSNYDLSLNL